MQSEAPLTLMPAPNGERRARERTCLGSLFGDPDTVPPKVPLSLRKRERVTCLPRRLRRRQGVRVRFDCMDMAQSSGSHLKLKFYYIFFPEVCLPCADRKSPGCNATIWRLESGANG